MMGEESYFGGFTYSESKPFLLVNEVVSHVIILYGSGIYCQSIPI